MTQATPVRVALFGSDRCRAEDFTASGAAPVLAMCRRLVRAGYNPATPLHAYRGDMLCLVVQSIGEGARLTVHSAGNGTPTFALDSPRRGAAAPPVRATALAAAL